MRRALESFALLAALAVGGSAWAAVKPVKPMDHAAYAAEKAKIEAQYQADRKLCDTFKGNREDVCEAEADGRQNIDAYHAQLKDRGVDVDAEVSRFGDPVPPLFWFRDLENNTLMVVEVR